MNFLDSQKEICKRLKVACEVVDPDSIAGISDNVGDGSMPINGLRHPSDKGYSGWYIWAGDLKETDGFFKPTHTKHLAERFPQAIRYLGLPSGMRFQIDDKGYEDVWEDRRLLDV